MVRVPQDQATLAAAVQVAAEGAEIQLSRGTHRGDVSVPKALTITGESGATIEGTVRISARNVTVRGVKIVGGVEIRDSTSFALDRVTVASSRADAILIEGSTGLLTGCVIEDAAGSGVVALFTSRVSISSTTVRRCAKGGIVLLLGSQVRITDSVIAENRGDGISAAGSAAHIQGITVRGNVGCGIRADAGSTVSGSASAASTNENQGGNLCGTAFTLDLEPPTIRARIEPQPNAAGWNSSDVRVAFDCTDPLSGIASCPEPRAISQEGVHEVTGEAADRAGNRASATATVRLDRTPPTGSVQIDGGASATSSFAVTLRVVANDEHSGVGEMRFSNDGRTWSPWEPYVEAARWVLTGYGGEPIEGTKTVHVQVKDRADNASAVFSSTISLLASSAPLPAPANLQASPSGWSNAASFTVDWDDPPQIPPRAAAWYKIGSPPQHPEDGTRVTAKPIPLSPGEDGEHRVYVWLEDAAGRRDHTLSSTIVVRSDRTPPQITAGTPQGTVGGEGWYRGDVTVSFTASDNLSGFAPDGQLRADATRTSSGEGADIRVQFTISDVAGNAASVTAGPFRVDKTPPTITAQPSRPPDREGWYNRDLTVSFSCDDALSGVARCPPPVTVSNDGRDQVVQGEAWDVAGNRAVATASVNVDKTPPIGLVSINAGAATTTRPLVTLTLAATDALSGVAEMRFSNDGSAWSDWEPFKASRPDWDLSLFGGSRAEGAKTVRAQVRDRAGNVSAVFTASIRYAAPPPTTSMVLIPAGSFRMGDHLDGMSDASPVHTVSVSAFYMDRYEVTKALWDEVAGWAQANGYDLKPSDGSGKAPNHPVYDVSWYEAVKWLNARSEKEGRTPAYYTSAAKTAVYRTGRVDVQIDWVRWDTGYRLPTEAEWERAARGGCEGHRFPWCDSDTITHSRANYESSSSYSYDTSPSRGSHPAYATGGSPYTSPVGSFAPNGYGLYDMAGNVWEWCWDRYSSGYYASSPGTDPRGPASGSSRAIRGGSWINLATYCRVSPRYYAGPALEDSRLGFRAVLPPGS